MADNLIADPGVGGATLATDEISSVHYPINKITFGALDSQTLASSGAGNVDAGTQRVVLASDQAVVEVDNSGTFAVQSAQSGTWNITNISGTVSLPTGAATAAKQLADGHNVTAVGAAAENAAVSGNPVLTGGRFDTSDRTLGDGDVGAIALDINGHTITSAHAESLALADDLSNTVNIEADHAGGFIAKAAFGYNFDGTTWDRVRGDATNGLLVNLGTNNDVAATLSAETTKVIGTVNVAAAQTIAVTNAGTFPVQVDAALPAGTNAIGKLAANSGVDIGDVDILSIAAGAAVIGDVGLSGARTSGGTTLYKNIDVDETEDAVKVSAGQVYWIHAINTTAAIVYLKLYNATVGTVIVGTTVPDLTFPVPGNSTTGAGFTLSIPNGIEFTTAITIAATTGVADNDTGAPGANALVVNLGYA